MTKQEYNGLQRELSNLLEKTDSSGRKVHRSQDYKDAVLASKSVIHNWFLYRNKDVESKPVSANKRVGDASLPF